MIRWRALFVAAAAVLTVGAATPDPQADAVLDEIDLARTDPRAYAARLREWRSWFVGDVVRRPGLPGLVTVEGPAAVDEAIAFLEAQAPLPGLARDVDLDRAAADHARDQGRTGETGHVGSDGSTLGTRVRRHGAARGMGENIAYGSADARETVIQLIVDDDVPGRGHRTNIFNRDWTRAGAACGPHPVWRRVCVIDFAY
jgi:uncharacterized protein YkwD